MKSDNFLVKLIILTIFSIYLINPVIGQEIQQTIRGKVMDQDSQSSLPGANVIILNTEPILGGSTDMNGNFRIDNVPLGRIDLKISYLGYEEKIIPNLLLTSAKEVVLEIQLQESLQQMQEVKVTANREKSEVDNEMAQISARSFSVEETKRYAGSFNDPARMVSAYAGAATDPQGDNFIIVRGNSPKGIQWRLEGIEIPNPNHFADEGSTGGPINALNSNMLDNSEFYTGAFPAEYGNAFSGVFDMKLRKGNNQQREYSLSLGALGVDAAMEGPFKKGSGASYLFNYRYSSLSLLDQLGLVDFGGVPVYQDASFNVFLPSKSFGTFSIFGLGGMSNIVDQLFDEEVEGQEILLEESDYSAKMGVVGINHFLPLNDKSYLRNSISTSINGSGFDYFEPDQDALLKLREDMQLDKNTIKAASTLHHKFNAQHKLQSGLVYTKYFFDFSYNRFDDERNEFVAEQKIDGKADHYQGFVSWKYRPSQVLSLVTGFHVHGTDLNDEISFEPRASLRWQFDVEQAFTLGFGLHGKMESLPNYFSIIPTADGTPGMPNKNIEFSKARHYVLGYENKLNSKLFLKMEAYYQELYNIPVENDPNSSYSLINQVSGFTDRVLLNQGTGENLGLEISLERYFDNNYYFLATASLYDSKYKAMDEVERDTRFNGNYVGNFLFGKEFELNTQSDNKKVIGINTKFSYMGARKYTPIELQASKEQGRTIRMEDKAFSEKGDDVFIANIALSYRIDSKKISQEFKLDIQNASNHAARIDQFYDSKNDKIVYSRQLSLLPVVMYTIHF